MNDPLSEVEDYLASLAHSTAPPGLRDAVMANVRRELQSSRRDQLLARAAAALIAVGLTLNVVTASNARSTGVERHDPTSQALFVRTAATLAQATDAETGRRIARQLAAWNGLAATRQQRAALELALNAELPPEGAG
jgi:hypothetical protein